jgi:hypothetical protein
MVPAEDDVEQVPIQRLIKTYSLAEVAAMVLPPELKCGTRWLAERLNRNEIHGYKVGRAWRMTEADVMALIDRYSNTVKPPEPRVPDVPDGPPRSIIDGLTPRGRRRVRYEQGRAGW